MDEKRNPKPGRREPPEYLARTARIWATGPLLGGRLVMAYRFDDLIQAICPQLYDADGPVGERRAVRYLLAERSAAQLQQVLISEWQAGKAGFDRWRLAEQDWGVEQCLLAPKDRRLDNIPTIWPEGPPLVLCRHRYAEPDVEAAEPDTRVWVDGRTTTQLVRSWVALGELTVGRL